MQNWNKYEMDVAKEIVNIGLAKAADSLSFFTKEKVFINGLDIQISPIDNFECNHINAEYHALTTEIKGDVTGKCHLLFSQDDAENFFEIALPESVKSTPELKAEMGKEMLKEADNIITAAVVTQFANILKVKMHGYVPLYNIVSCPDIKPFLLGSTDDTIAYLHFRAALKSETVNVCPEFIWMLDDVFMGKVQKFVKKEANILKLKSLKISSN